MTKIQILDTIAETVKDHPNTYGMILFSKQNSEIRDFIFENTRFLDMIPNIRKNTRVYCVLNNITELPACRTCGKKICRNIKSINTGFAKYCSPKCENSDPSVLKKLNETNMKKYGTKWSFQSRNNIEKSAATMLERYGVNYAQQNKRIKSKQKNTMETIYGKKYPMQCADIREKAVRTRRKGQYLKISSHGEILPMFDENTYIENGNDFMYEWKCKKCGSVFQSQINSSWFKQGNNGAYARCEKCYPYMNGSSTEETEFFEFIKSEYDGKIEHGVKILKTDENPMHNLEIDVYLPDMRVGFEFDGLFWHSFQYKGNENYHLLKTRLAEAAGIRLIHVFENEWTFKRKITESRIRNLLGIHDKTIFARKCEIREIDSNTSTAFQNENHIQGSANASVNIGLFDGGDLVSLMTFGKCRFDRKHEWEMIRFCSKLGYHIPGAASRLLKYFERKHEPESIVTYADRRWSDGNLYFKLGFTLDHISKPDYWYFKGQTLESRFKYQKHKLRQILPMFDENKTEIENMDDNGFMRIYDCGNMVFIKKNDD